MDGEVLRHTEQLLVQLAEPPGGDGRDDLRGGLRKPFLRGRRRSEAGLERLVHRPQLLGHLPEEPVRLRLRHSPFRGEPLCEYLAHGRVIGDLRRHQRLRVRRFLLVVAVSAIPDDVDDDVALEPPAEREREPDR